MRDITRRDFVNGTLAGTGAVLLGMPAPAHAQGLTATWTGYAGVGDYARSNGNIATVVNDAHAMRDGRYDDAIANARLVDDVYDLVVVGGGFAGLGATYEFKKARPSGSVLLIENHPVPGGEAKQNAFEVDGVQLIAPQGSNGTLSSRAMPYPIGKQYWDDLGIPTSFDFVEPTGAASHIRVARENYESMFWDENLASTGWFFNDGSLVVDPFSDRLARAPLDAKTTREWLAWHDANAAVVLPAGVADESRWLDSMSYGEYITNVMGLSSAVFPLADPLVSVGDYGVSASAISAYAAKLLGLPGPAGAKGIGYDESLVFSFPGGNSTIARYIFKALVPEAIAGGSSFGDVAGGAFSFEAFDRPGARVRVRVASTAVAVRHEGSPETARLVDVAYVRDGSLERVRARSVVMAGGGWVNKHVVRDLPPELHAAYDQFHHAPILVANVALTNWRAMAKLGISALRWLDGLGFFANIRRPMHYPGYDAPLDPDKPTVLTFYIGFPKSGAPLTEQASLGRAQLFSTSYAEYEKILREQLQSQLGRAGFDHQRDIAAIVLNRWGHAYLAPQPGFYFNPDGSPGPSSVVQRGYGRVFFGHSELSGRQNWPHALDQGKRACYQAIGAL